MTLQIFHPSLTLGAERSSGDVGRIFDGEIDGDPVVVKVASAPANNFLIENERKVLRLLTEGNVFNPDIVPELAQIDRIRYAAYMPTLVDVDIKAEDSGSALAANAFKPLDGLYPLSQIVTDLGPLHAKDVAWMWRRVLVALGFVHSQGFVHAAIYPEHIMIQPEQHGVVLIDWCYARPLDTPAHAYISRPPMRRRLRRRRSLKRLVTL